MSRRERNLFPSIAGADLAELERRLRAAGWMVRAWEACGSASWRVVSIVPVFEKGSQAAQGELGLGKPRPHG